jgi:hypothetical protein
LSIDAFTRPGRNDITMVLDIALSLPLVSSVLE